MVFVRFFLSHSTKKSHRVTLLCFTIFLVSKKLMDKRGGDHHFPSEMYCVTVPKQNVQKSFSVSLIQVSKTFCIRGIDHDFLSMFLVSQCRKRFVDESFSVSFIFGY